MAYEPKSVASSNLDWIVLYKNRYDEIRILEIRCGKKEVMDILKARGIKPLWCKSVQQLIKEEKSEHFLKKLENYS